MKNLILIVGTGRSGTSLLKSILDNQKNIASFGNEFNSLWHPGVYPEMKIKDHLIPKHHEDPLMYTIYSIFMNNILNYDNSKTNNEEIAESAVNATVSKNGAALEQYKNEKKLLQEKMGILQINPKVDSKTQRRVQCSFKIDQMIESVQKGRRKKTKPIEAKETEEDI